MPSVAQLMKAGKPGANPLTVLSLAASTWILVIGINELWLSVAVIAGAWITSIVKLKNLSVVWTTLVLSIPVFLSMLLIHGLFGESSSSVRFFTSDGVALAVELGLRFTALMATMLAAMSLMKVSTLVKALQASGVHPKFGYILGSAVQLLPQGSQTIKKVRDARQLRGDKPSRVRGVVMPVIISTMSQAADRAVAVEVSGLDLPGKRTVLREVYDSEFQRIIRWAAPLMSLVAVVICLWY